jgi:hypothetical protein
MKSLARVLFVLILGGCASAPRAGGMVDVTVVNRATGERIEVYRHRGKLYVAGTPGDKYAVVLRNHRAERVLAVVSVDGVNVVSGETASPQQTGYVLDPYDSVEINGWRKSLNEVAAFVFTALPDSYAARTGRPDNVGVIGVAVFREKVLPPPVALSAPQERSSAESADVAAGVRKRAEKLGTGHGERETSHARYTGFERASDRPDQLVTIYYDSRANLVARGVIPRPTPRDPNPFPGRFVPDPWG